MKQTKWLMMLIASLTLGLVACEPEPAPQPTPETGAFEVAISNITYTSADVVITPEDFEMDYICALYDAETVEGFRRDEYIVETIMQELEAEARLTGKTLLEYMPEVVDRGILEETLDGLASEAKYYVLVFGVDAADGYKACTDLVKVDFTTEAAPELEVTFEIETTVDGNSAEYVVTPSNDEDIWYFYTIPMATFDYYTSAESYNMSDQEFLLYCMQMEIDAYRQAGYTDNDIMNAIFHKGTLTLMAQSLNANTEYINMVAGFIVTPEGLVTIATGLTTTTYTTGNAKAKSLSFDISVTDVEAMRAAIMITPSNNNDTFCWMCGAWDGVQTAEEIMNGIVAAYGGWMNNGAMLYKGVQDFTGGPNCPYYKYKLDAADTDYYVIAFGYAGGITTEPEMVTFRTLPAPAAEDTTFTMTASNPSPYGFTVGVTPSESTTYYTFNVMTNEQYAELDVDALAEELNAQFDEILAMQQQFDPNITVAQVLSLYYYRGNYTADASGMAPETMCSGFVMALSPETGHVVKVHQFPDVATTGKLGSVSPTVELVGNWSGDEENGSVFGNAAATQGKAITVVKYGNFEGARSLFSAMLGDDATNSVAFPDATLWGTLSAYWKTASMAQPYTFYVTSWDEPQTAFAYAVDGEGNPGAIGRCYSMATVENKADIADLKALVDELNAAEESSIAMPQSIVIGEATGVVLDNFVGEDTTAVEEVVMESVPAIESEIPFQVTCIRAL